MFCFLGYALSCYMLYHVFHTDDTTVEKTILQQLDKTVWLEDQVKYHEFMMNYYKKYNSKMKKLD